MKSGISKIREDADGVKLKLAESVVKWTDLAQEVGIKSALETYLAAHIAELTYITGKSRKKRKIICTSNSRLASVFSAKKKSDIEKLSSGNSSFGMHTRDSLTIKTYNLTEGHYETVPIGSVSVSPVSVPVTNLSPENVVLLAKVLHECLTVKHM